MPASYICIIECLALVWNFKICWNNKWFEWS